jgi:hypothetical protein
MAGCLFWVALLALFIFVGWQAVPAKVRDADFEEFLARQAESAGRASAEQIKERVLARAKTTGVPLEPKNLTVSKDQSRIVIECSYEVPITILVYTYNWRFEHKVDRPFFIV